MLNMKELEGLRTKSELINYFKALGKSITEEEIEALKKSYEKAQENSNTLTMEQLDDVAGGLKVFFINHVSGLLCTDKAYEYDVNKLLSFINESEQSKNQSIVNLNYLLSKGQTKIFIFVNDGNRSFSRIQRRPFSQT